MKLSGSDSLELLFGQVIRLYYCRTHILLGELGIYPGQPPILHLLWRKDGRRQKEFAQLLNLKPPTVTVMLNRMEKAGWVERVTDPDDLRVTRVYLTEQAKNMRPKMERVLNTINQECFAGLSDEEKILLRQLLKRVRENLHQPCVSD